MKIYKVKVNGKVYEVELEAVSEAKGEIKADATPSEPQTQAQAKAGTELKAPMAGTILKVNVNVGDQIKKGDVVCILEAMKLENEIRSGFDGKVIQIVASKGTQVAKGQTLIILG